MVCKFYEMILVYTNIQRESKSETEMLVENSHKNL